MKRFGLFGFVLIVAALLPAWSARGADAGIPAAYKGENDPSGHRTELTQKIADQVAKLANDQDPSAQSAAREWLIAESINGTAAQTAPGYLNLYSDVLNKALEPLIKDANASARAKANATIIAGKVSELSSTANLLPSVMAALNDKSEAMALLGEKAAGQILPAIFNNVNVNAKDKTAFMDAIVNAVKEHLATPRAGLIAEDAYNALTKNIQAAPATASAQADAVIALQRVRSDLYLTANPDSPDADTFGTLFLMSAQQWATLTKPQQFAAMQNTVNLLCYAAQRGSAIPGSSNQEFIHAINHFAQMIETVAVALNNPALQAAVQPAKNLQIGNTGAALINAWQPIFPAVQAIPDFKELKKPLEFMPVTRPSK